MARITKAEEISELKNSIRQYRQEVRDIKIAVDYYYGEVERLQDLLKGKEMQSTAVIMNREQEIIELKSRLNAYREVLAENKKILNRGR